MTLFLFKILQIAGADKLIEESFAESFGIGVLAIFCLFVCGFCFTLWKQQSKREKEFVDMVVAINSEMVKVVSENTSAVSKLQQSIDFLFKHQNNSRNGNQ